MLFVALLATANRLHCHSVTAANAGLPDNQLGTCCLCVLIHQIQVLSQRLRECARCLPGNSSLGLQYMLLHTLSVLIAASNIRLNSSVQSPNLQLLSCSVPCWKTCFPCAKTVLLSCELMSFARALWLAVALPRNCESTQLTSCSS